MPTYQVKDWNKNFENAKSRQIDRCSSVHLPNKAAGLGLSRVLAEEDGAAVFGIFVLLVEACSRHPRPRDGWLTRDGHPEATPWTLSDLEVIVHRPPLEIKRALDVLSSPAIGWIAVSGEYPADDHEVSTRYAPGSRAVDPNERTKEQTNERKNERPRQPFEPDPEIPLADAEPLEDTDIAGVKRHTLVEALVREEIPENRWKDVLSVVEKSLRFRGTPPPGVKDNPTGYALKVIKSKAAEIQDALAADKAAKRDMNVARFKAGDFTQEERAGLVEKYRKMFPGIQVVFDDEAQPFEPDREPPPSPEPETSPPENAVEE